MTGYDLYRKDKVKRGGGVCIHLREDLDSAEVTEQELCEQGLKQIWCNSRIGVESVLVECIYRPPGSDGNVMRYLKQTLTCA